MIQEQLRRLGELFEVTDRRLVSVAEVRTEGLTEALVLSLPSVDVRLDANSEFDTVEISLIDRAGVPVQSTGDVGLPWASFIDQQMSWAWLTVNYQGYPDGLVFSFGAGLTPHLICVVSASSFEVVQIGSLGKEGTPRKERNGKGDAAI